MTSIRRIGGALKSAGFNPVATLEAARHLPKFAFQWWSFRRRGGRVRLFPILTDYRDSAGQASSEYFLADLWMARQIREFDAERHVDVGSRLDGLVAHLLTFRTVDMVDIRPLVSAVDGLRFVQGDATSLSNIADASVPSVSSVHAVEHFGLGRYGDPLDVDGHLRGMESLARICSGRVFLGVPVGKPRVEFNAHRVLDPLQPIDVFHGYDLVKFAAVIPGRGLVLDTCPSELSKCEYSVGLFVFDRSQ